ncbi:MAG: acetyltransferase [uncultured bacterium]|nr:MAG: acetyltransferase [uncultured bacterium]
MKLELKRATLKDVQEVMDIENSASSATYVGNIKVDEVRLFIKNESVFLIKRGKITIGGIAYKIQKTDYARLKNLALYTKYRGKGLAAQAILMLLNKLKNFKRVDLTVHPHNSRAISLYLSLGFIIESWQDNYYGDGESRLILVLVKNKKK